MQPSSTNAKQAGNVSILGFISAGADEETGEQQAPPAAAPAVDPSAFLELQRSFAEMRAEMISTLKTDLPKFIQQISENAVKQSLHSSQMTILGAFQAIGTVLAVRFILLLALIGAFVLAWSAMANPTYPAIIILISYVLLTVLPLVWLERSGRQNLRE